MTCVDPTAPGSKWLCSKDHANIFIARRSIGYYDKLVDRVRCVVSGCDYWGPGLQEHHILPRSEGGSDDLDNLVWVCPNHHTLIHSGLAIFDGRRIIDLRARVRRDEMQKRRFWKDRAPTGPRKSRMGTDWSLAHA